MAILKRWNKPVDAAGLGFVRVALGVILLVEVTRFFTNGWIDGLYGPEVQRFPYLGLGWVGCVTGIVLIRRLGVRAARSLIYGGLAYSFGAVFEFLQPPFLIPGVIGPHEVFHFAVIVGVIYHWGFVKQATLLALTPTSGA